MSDAAFVSLLQCKMAFVDAAKICFLTLVRRLLLKELLYVIRYSICAGLGHILAEGGA